jgi:hypothetical protein
MFEQPYLFARNSGRDGGGARLHLRERFGIRHWRGRDAPFDVIGKCSHEMSNGTGP